MAASFVRKLGTKTGGGTQSITVAAGGAAAGDLVCVGVGNDTNALTITDSAGGNTWSLGKRHILQNAECALFYSVLVNAIPGAGTITATGAAGITAMAAATWTGIAASPLDAAQGNSAAGATNLSTLATGVTVQADELAVAWFYAGNLAADFTQGGSYSLLDSIKDVTNNQSAGWEYLVLTSTGAQTATGTESSGINYDGVIVTFKAVVTQPILLPRMPLGV